jgi:peroxiredoxin
MVSHTGAAGITELAPGDPAPWFQQRTSTRDRFVFDTAAGRFIVLCFFASAGDDAGAAACAALLAQRHLFDDTRLCCFGVSLDPADEAEARFGEHIPGIRVFWDFDGRIGRLYGALPGDWRPGDGWAGARRFWVVLDPSLRVTAVFALGDAGVFAYLAALPAPDRFPGFAVQAPVLFLANVFEAELCRRLIDLYEADGGGESGFMRDIDGRTVGLYDSRLKRRRDYTVTDPALTKLIRARIIRRIIPEIWKVHHFSVTRMERYIVGCYAAEDDGHFHPHRDDTMKGTAHRRFGVSINLNDDFEGGELAFPEYGGRGYKMAAGGAVVFSGSLLHAVNRVTQGRRYAFLPFLYDEAAAKLRAENMGFIEGKA